MKKIVLEHDMIEHDFNFEDLGFNIVIFHKDARHGYENLQSIDYETIKKENLKPFPLFVYDHSIQVFKSSKTCQWDSYRIGTIYAKDWYDLENQLEVLTDIWNGFAYNIALVDVEKCKCCGTFHAEVEDNFLILQSELYGMDDEDIQRQAMEYFGPVAKGLPVDNKVMNE